MTEVAENIDVTDEQVEAFVETGELPEITEQPEAEQKPEQEPQQDKTVPYGALHEERMRRKELQAELRSNGEKVQKMEERFNQLMERLKAPQPDYEDDPVEALKSQTERLASEVAQQKQYQDQQNMTVQQQNELNAFIGKYRSSAQAYMKDVPDFNDAYNHYMGARMEELETLGYGPQDAGSIFGQEELIIAQKAYEDEVNPAQRIYELAKIRGYSKKQQDKLENVQRGMETNRSLASTPSKTQIDVSLEALADMSDEEFDANWDKLFK